MNREVVVLGLIGYAGVSSVLALVAGQGRRLAEGDPGSSANYDLAHKGFILASLISIFSSLALLLPMIPPPRELLFRNWHADEDYCRWIEWVSVALVTLVFLFATGVLARASRLSEKLNEHLRALQRDLIVKVIEDHDNEGVTEGDISKYLAPHTTFKVGWISDATIKLSNLGSRFPLYFGLLKSTFGDSASKMLQGIVPTNENISQLVDELQRSGLVIVTTDGHLVAKSHVDALLKLRKIRVAKRSIFKSKQKYEWNA